MGKVQDKLNRLHELYSAEDRHPLTDNQYDDVLAEIDEIKEWFRANGLHHSYNPGVFADPTVMRIYKRDGCAIEWAGAYSYRQGNDKVWRPSSIYRSSRDRTIIEMEVRDRTPADDLPSVIQDALKLGDPPVGWFFQEAKYDSGRFYQLGRIVLHENGDHAFRLIWQTRSKKVFDEVSSILVGLGYVPEVENEHT